uniref:Ig-like domain-containing protein n=1 Tax=Anabas testudineus TaxID=64144 RepID=A0A7N6A825_ANATE
MTFMGKHIFPAVHDRTPPCVHVEIPNFDTELKATCSVQTAFDAKVTWLIDGVVQRGGTVSTNKNPTHVMSTLTVSSREWRGQKTVTCKKGSSFTCKSTHNNVSLTKEISICQIHDRTPPCVHVEIPSFDAEMKATCSVQTAFDAKVTWLIDGVVQRGGSPSPDRNATHVMSTLTVSSREWREQKTVTCKAELNHLFSISESQIVAPKITLHPVWEDGFVTSPVKLICTLSGYFPDTLSVQWQQNNQPLNIHQIQKKLQSVEGGQKTFSLSSEIEPNKKEWEKGSSFTCKSSHNNVPITKEIRPRGPYKQWNRYCKTLTLSCTN